MNAVVLLTHLEGARRNGNGWRANCPNGHEKARGSLAIATADDDRILLSCFACYDTLAILRTLGLELANLFLERIKGPSPEASKAAHQAFKRSAWAAGLGVLDREATVTDIVAHDMTAGQLLNTADHDRPLLACQRIQGAREVLL